MLTSLSAYLRVSRLFMITRLGRWRMTFNPKAKSENFSLRKSSSLDFTNSFLLRTRDCGLITYINNQMHEDVAQTVKL